MRITESNLQTQSAAYAYTRQSQHTTLDVSIGSGGTTQASSATPSALVELSSESLAAQEGAEHADSFDPKLSLLISLIERLTGRKVQLFDAASMGDEPSRAEAAPPQAPSSAPNAQGLEWSIHFESRRVREEAEAVGYQAKGSVTTADGRKIDFELGLTMQRYQRTETSLSFDAGNAPKQKDPLVLNLTSDQVRLSGESVRFDLDLDGQQDRLAKLAVGSGYLVLDRNRNGKIDDGKELFGPASGDGFSELSALDSDRNGWIDEGDTAYGQLAVWRPEEGSTSLVEAGVGAIALDRRATPYTLKVGDTEGGSIRTTGIFLTEAGEAKTMQQIDLVAG